MPKSTACRRCGEARHYTGSRWRCSRCFNEWQKGRRENLSPARRAAERETANALRLVARNAWTPEKRAMELARTQAWRDADPERHKAGSRDWYERNADQARAAKRAEYYAFPEKFYAQNWVRKARLSEAVCDHGPKCVTAKFLKGVQGVPCTYCGEPATAADHFYPIARGGLHCVMNIVPACGSCNSRKSARDPHVWMAEMGLSL